MDLRRAAAVCALAGPLALAGCAGGGSGAPAPAATAPAAVTTPVTTPAPTPSARPAGPYAALGDSYTSGLQVPPQQGTPKGCARSGANYPSLVAARLGLAGPDFRDVSCSGARTADLAAAQQTSGGANPPQLDALTADTRLVTLGIGGNDAGLMDVLGRCALESAKHAVASALTGSPAASGATAGAPCQEYYTAADGTDQVGRRIEATGPKVTEAVAAIRQRAPRATVLVVGYPALLPADPAACTATLGSGVAPGDLAFLGREQQRLNAVLRQAAEGAGARFVDTYAPSAGHDMCAGEAERWVEPPMPAPGLAALHPNTAGEAGMAAAVLAAATAS
ncbi:SGNH/GDSL hydrolase family protein [Kitasatospora sp. NPDC094015]|uniref:SGNH/GDSL hydrolase family protein n=1 Tax=Kitasatospora sp. NPDC094015 TaxID=3155205 RepID=UPI00331B5C68